MPLTILRKDLLFISWVVVEQDPGSGWNPAAPYPRKPRSPRQVAQVPLPASDQGTRAL
jgi:hypothetical protein